MTDQQKEFVRSKVLQFIEGNISETNKLDFKREWYKLKDKTERGYWEFLKDTCAIINSYGGDEGYIIIGVDEESKELYNTKIEDSGRNQNEIKDIIISNIADRFVIDIDDLEVNGKKLSVIWIPPSTNKPHVILKYHLINNQKEKPQIFENEIFIRNGTGTNVANKGDLDRMYWERGNILLNQKLIVTIDLRSFFMSIQTDINSMFFVDINMHFNFENEGLRPISIYDMKLDFEIEKFNSIELLQDIKFFLKRGFYNTLHTSINPNSSTALNVEFRSNQLMPNIDIEKISGFVRSIKFNEVVLKDFRIRGRKGMIDHELHIITDNEL